MSSEAITQRMNELNKLWEIAVMLRGGHDIEGAWFFRASPPNARLS